MKSAIADGHTPGSARGARERALAQDLSWVAAELGSELSAWERVSPLWRPAGRRAAFRVGLSDGRWVKLRRMGPVDEAEALARRLGGLAAAGLPRVLGRRGGSLILEWIPGAAFAEQPLTDERIEQAGRLLGEIHRARVPADDPEPRPRRAARELARAEVQLAELANGDCLTRLEVDTIAGLLVRHVGERPLQGVVHGDFAPENLVVDARGALRVIDNESVDVGILDLDLARAWARWALADERWRIFLEGYAGGSGRRVADPALWGWKLRSLVVSAWYRCVFELPGGDAAVARLRAFAACPPGPALAGLALGGDRP